MAKKCSVDGCDRKHSARGMCATHYARWRTTGEVGGAEIRPLRTHGTTCSVDGCDKPHKCHGLCGTHYARFRSNGTTDLKTDDARFWEKVNRNGPSPGRRPDLGPCWVWLSGKSDSGYGTFWVGGRGGRKVQAHRFAYELTVGPIPDGLQIDHLCKTRDCVNPAHLEPVTPAVNNERSDSPSARNARKDRCPKGHEFTPENTRILPDGARSCRVCGREAARRWKSKNKERVAEYMREYRKSSASGSDVLTIL